MIKIRISATGKLKAYIPESNEMELKEDITLTELKAELGIPSSVPCGFVVNGKMVRGHATVADNDDVKLVMVVGAG